MVTSTAGDPPVLSPVQHAGATNSVLTGSDHRFIIDMVNSPGRPSVGRRSRGAALGT